MNVRLGSARDARAKCSPDEVRQSFKRIEWGLTRGRACAPSTTARTSARMARVRQYGTDPELLVRAAARAAGLRYTLANRDLPGSPDLANRTRRFAIFVHGCFWHRHAGCVRATTPKSNRAFWIAKFERNTARDRASIRTLKKQGFRVLVIWECEVAQQVQLAHVVSTLLPRV